MKQFDSIVIGLGGMGSAAVCELARRGQHVVGIEQFSFGHALGSSHGQSRIIRQAYFEHPDYVPLLQAAYAGWERLATTTDEEIINLCGLLLAGPAEGEVVAGTHEAATRHELPLETLSRAAALTRFPDLRIPANDTILHDPLGGYLRVEACVKAHLNDARDHGATLFENEPVLDWQAEGSGVVVRTAHREFRADRLVLCAGAWAKQVMTSLDLPLVVRRMVTAWFPTTTSNFRQEKGFPVFAFQTSDGFFYGFPQLDGRGIKIACHEPGDVVVDPANVDRVLSAADTAPLQAFVRKYLSDVDPNPSDGSVCLYTMSPDEHFIVDIHPTYPQVCFAAGFSGHGFKFCPVIGAILADLAIDGQTSFPAEFLRVGRLG